MNKVPLTALILVALLLAWLPGLAAPLPPIGRRRRSWPTSCPYALSPGDGQDRGSSRLRGLVPGSAGRRR
jgi:hypothetical protein